MKGSLRVAKALWNIWTLKQWFLPRVLQKHMASQHQVDVSPPSRTASRTGPPYSPFGLPCMYCTKDGFNNVEALQLHIQAMHGESSSCLTSSNRFLRYCNLFSVSVGSLLNGDLAGFAGLANLAGLAASQPPSATPSASMLSCELCTMRFNSMSGLQRHQRTVHGLGSRRVGSDCLNRRLLFRSPLRKTDQVKRRVSKINQVKEYISKNNQLQCIRIAVDCFFQINAFIWSILNLRIRN